MSMLGGYRNRRSLENSVVDVFCRVSIGASGAATLQTTWTNGTASAGNGGSPSKGIVSVTKNAGAGNYTFQFGQTQNGANINDLYYRLLDVEMVSNTAGVGANTPAAAPDVAVVGDSLNSAGTLTVVTSLTASAANPANGEVLLFHFIMCDSSI